MKSTRRANVDWAMACLGPAMVLFGILSWFEARRITTSLRRPGVYDVVGPDRYLEGVAVVLMVIGGLLTVAAIRSFRRGADVGEVPADESGWGVHGVLLLILIGYAVALPWLGLFAATATFFACAFRAMAFAGWRKSLPVSLVLALGVVAIFVWVAGMPVPVWPKGL